MKRARCRVLNGILLLDKPAGISSNAALQRARRLFDARKAGHTGNLDVLASGLLPVCFGEATKVCAFLLDADKQYEADITFGLTTTTDDGEGEILTRAVVPSLHESEVCNLLKCFTGDVQQVPPMYSALKHRGQRLYKLAHQGIAVERQARPVSIKALDLLAINGNTVSVNVCCSKGTYVRTLAADIGKLSGYGAYLSRLRRTAAGPFQLAGAVSFEQLERLAEEGDINAMDSVIQSIDSALSDRPKLALGVASSVNLQHGQTVHVANVPHRGIVRLYNEDHTFLGIGEIVEGGRVMPRRLLQMGRNPC